MIGKAKKAGATQRVYDYVLEKIQSHEWSPGSKIESETNLAVTLGTSRLPVREALNRLSAIGLLVKKQGSGTYVMDVSAGSVAGFLMPLLLIERKELRSVLEFRLYFETGNIELFMRNPDEAIVDELQRHYDSMVLNASIPDVFSIEDFAFHLAIAKGTRNPFIIRIGELLTSVLVSHQSHLNARIGSEVGLNYHRKIIEAIKNRDRELAVLLMRRHIEATIESVDAVSSESNTKPPVPAPVLTIHENEVRPFSPR